MNIFGGIFLQKNAESLQVDEMFIGQFRMK
jgi:hypothetical protein